MLPGFSAENRRAIERLKINSVSDGFFDPAEAVDGPGEIGTQAEAVAPFVVDVEFERNGLFSQGGGEEHTVFGRHAQVFSGVPEEAGRGLGSDV